MTSPISRSAAWRASWTLAAASSLRSGAWAASSSIHLMPASGVRSWWVTNETKSDFIWLTCCSWVTSRSVSVNPIVVPAASFVGWPTQWITRPPRRSSRSPRASRSGSSRSASSGATTRS